MEGDISRIRGAAQCAYGCACYHALALRRKVGAGYAESPALRTVRGFERRAIACFAALALRRYGRRGLRLDLAAVFGGREYGAFWELGICVALGGEQPAADCVQRECAGDAERYADKKASARNPLLVFVSHCRGTLLCVRYFRYWVVFVYAE